MPDSVKTRISSEYTRLYKNVFKSFLKYEYIDWAEQTFMGRLFQARGPATEKAVAKR